MILSNPSTPSALTETPLQCARPNHLPSKKNDFAVNDFAKSPPLPNRGKRSWTELTEFGKFTALRKTPSTVLPEEWRVSRFMPKMGLRKTQKHFQTPPTPKPSAPPKPPPLPQKSFCHQ